MADEWTYGTILKRSDQEGTAHWPHHRLMYVAAGSTHRAFRAVALVHTNRDRANQALLKTWWDPSKWAPVDE